MAEFVFKIFVFLAVTSVTASVNYNSFLGFIKRPNWDNNLNFYLLVKRWEHFFFSLDAPCGAFVFFFYHIFTFTAISIVCHLIHLASTMSKHYHVVFHPTSEKNRPLPTLTSPERRTETAGKKWRGFEKQSPQSFERFCVLKGSSPFLTTSGPAPVCSSLLCGWGWLN